MGIYLVLKNEFIRSLKNKKKLIIALLVPIIAIIISMGVNSIMRPTINLGIIDESLHSDFKEKAEEVNGVKIKGANKEAVNSEMILGKYLASIEFKDNNSFVVKSLDSNFKVLIENIIDDYVSKGEIKGFKEILENIEKESLTISERGVGFIVLALMITSTINACNFFKDREDGILRRFYISPRKKFEYMLGIYLYNLIFTFIQAEIGIVVLSLLPINIGMRMSEFLIVGGVVSLISSSFGILMVCLLNDELKASLISSSIAMILALFGGAFIPIVKMPDALQILSRGSVVKWLIDFTRLAESGFASGIGFTPIIVICIMAMIGVLASIKVSERKFV